MYVELKIFNSLGKEIITLLNRELHAGTFETDWDASDYPTGIYFYTLSAGSFKETKKMILIK
jgi:hypothetical protein